MIELLIISVLINLILVYVSINVSRKFFKLQNYLQNVNDKFYDVYKKYIEAYQNLNRIDRNGMFSTDDEVGFSWKLIVGIFEEMNEILKELLIQTNGEKEVKK